MIPNSNIAGYMQAMAVVRFTFEGFHYWQGAGEERAYLGNKHRHLFHVEVKVTVQHRDREIEFHDLLFLCKSYLRDGSNFEGQSCEDIGAALIEKLQAVYGIDRTYQVGIFEDGEVGAEVTYTPANRAS